MKFDKGGPLREVLIGGRGLSGRCDWTSRGSKKVDAQQGTSQSLKEVGS